MRDRKMTEKFQHQFILLNFSDIFTPWHCRFGQIDRKIRRIAGKMLGKCVQIVRTANFSVIFRSRCGDHAAVTMTKREAHVCNVFLMGVTDDTRKNRTGALYAEGSVACLCRPPRPRVPVAPLGSHFSMVLHLMFIEVA